MADSARYDESRVLRHYIVENYRQLLNERERQIFSGWLIRRKSEASGKSAEEYFDDAEAGTLAAALGDDPDGKLEHVAQTVLRRHASEVFVNRCPACGRIVASPKARQCLWCGEDWH
ncbi:MAG: hypothetical protein H6839_10625 [Planctomycetes bacterium]|nr:hypothetical protein [Planctomycetota bacterium]